jgi:hypothetical protein
MTTTTTTVTTRVRGIEGGARLYEAAQTVWSLPPMEAFFDASLMEQFFAQWKREDVFWGPTVLEQHPASIKDEMIAKRVVILTATSSRQVTLEWRWRFNELELSKVKIDFGNEGSNLAAGKVLTAMLRQQACPAEVQTVSGERLSFHHLERQAWVKDLDPFDYFWDNIPFHVEGWS